MSRWDGGKVLEADLHKLEFRAAAYLSQDGVAIEEVSTGFDVHAYTSVITDAGQPTSRQEAKAHTFAPLYGATGFRTQRKRGLHTSRRSTKASQIGIPDWQRGLNTEMITTPSGRQFKFEGVRRLVVVR